jgi:hypothetical protein
MKRTDFNINTPIVFKATEEGKVILSKFFKGYEELCKIDEKGICSMQLWEVMRVFANSVTQNQSILFEQIQISMNQLIYIELTERGKEVLKQNGFGLFMPNEEGYYVMEMWEATRLFGNDMRISLENLFEKSVIEIPISS